MAAMTILSEVTVLFVVALETLMLFSHIDAISIH
jgi:hypothetical protein